MFTRLLTSGKFSELAPVLSGNDLALESPCKNKTSVQKQKDNEPSTEMHFDRHIRAAVAN